MSNKSKKIIIAATSIGLISSILYQILKRRKIQFLGNMNQNKKPTSQLLGKCKKNLEFTKTKENFELIFKDKKIFKEKMVKIRKDGLQNLQIVSDFDHTITSFYSKDKIYVGGVHGYFRNSKLISEKFIFTEKELYNKYSPYEYNTEITKEQMEFYLNEWYSLNDKNFKDENLTIAKVDDSIKSSPFRIRNNFDSLFKLCQEINIPFYVVSGGISNMIESIMNKIVNTICYKNFFIFSNEMEFDKDQKFLNLKHSVNTANKQNAIKGLENLKNSLLFGDIISDRDMANTETVLSIGFLIDEKANLINNYLEKYDLVIVGEGNFLLHEFLFRNLIGIEENCRVSKLIREDGRMKEFLSLFE